MQFDRLKRRQFITLLGGAAVEWPMAARAQQPAMPVIGFLGPASPGPYAPYVAGFRQGLKEAGFIEGQNVAIEFRWAENQNDRLPALAVELVRRQVSVIATLGTGAVAAKAATTTIPVVFLLGEDPVRLGLVASLARPGGNVTGLNLFSGEMTAKRLEILREILPAATRVAVLVNPTGPNAETTLRDVPPAASVIGLDVRIFKASTSREIGAAFEILARERPDALLVDIDPFLTSRRVQLVTLAARHAIPAAYAVREFAEIGGLMSYGSSLTDAYRQLGVYTARVLKGTKPAELPVAQASKFELIINAETARILGLTLPPMLLAPRRRGDRIGFKLLHCICRLVAHRVGSPRCVNSVAIGAIADIARSTAAPGFDANDPKRISA
jgi:putative tryptophan/tyrosine transport system substrate-binding protein